MELKIKILNDKIGKEIPVPFYATEGSAGMDLAACIDEPMTVEPMQRVLVPTGFAMALPSADYVAYIYARSSMGLKHGITLPNCVGVIDSDYRGEVKVAIVNLSDTPYTIQPGERIAQLVIAPVVQMKPVLTEELPETKRGGGGFGSTGR